MRVGCASEKPQYCCKIAGIDARTLQRWKVDESLVSADGRLGSRTIN
jgi:hypothetical protein